MRKFPRKSAACIEALKIVQAERKWVADDAVEDVAQILAMSPAEVDSVATFYNQIYRKPVGRHVIQLCDSISCWIKGCDHIKSQIQQKLNIGFGETSKDERFTLLPIQCLGNCDHAPSLMIDNNLYGDVQDADLDKIMEKYK
jgi:NADH-quinone oxidoreductase subunit E